MKVIAMIMPGTTPPANILPIERLAEDPIMTIGKLGGMRIPSGPLASKHPAASLFWYPLPSIAGIPISPMLTMAAAATPAMAAKIALMMTVAMASPPLREPHQR